MVLFLNQYSVQYIEIELGNLRLEAHKEPFVGWGQLMKRNGEDSEG